MPAEHRRAFTTDFALAMLAAGAVATLLYVAGLPVPVAILGPHLAAIFFTSRRQRRRLEAE